MKCPNCQHSVKPDHKFCYECGHKLQKACPQCQEKITIPDAKFCFSCGFKLSDPAPSSSVPKQSGIESPIQAVTPPLKKQAERRQLTVMFCDLVGSTALSEKLDAEDFRQVILDYQQISEPIIKKFGGYVAQYLGDGLLVYFGYPNALEKAPILSIRCALGILKEMAKQNLKRPKQKKEIINVRIGIHTGMVVVDDHLALGDTTNIAARIEGLAEVNTLAISAQTYNLSKGWFMVESKGKKHLKGISTPMEIFQVNGESEIRNKFELRDRLGLTPLTGRDEELGVMLNSLKKVQQGQGQVVMIEGESGIGKSRLIEELRLHFRGESDNRIVNFFCSSHYQNSPYFPIKDFFERKYLGYTSNTPAEEKIENLKAFLENNKIDHEEHFKNMLELLELNSLTNISIAEPSYGIEDTLSEIFIKIAEQGPVLLVAEDIQWADPSMENWMDQFLNNVDQHSIFFVVSSRKEFPVFWTSGIKNSRRLKLSNLTGEEIEIICKFLAKNKKVPQQILERIKERTDGIPLFIEELTRIVLQSSSLIEEEDEYRLVGAIEDLMIPSSLRDSLMARLDQLNVFKKIIQLGSVLGREFDYKILEKVAEMRADRLQEDLSKLVDLGFLFEKGDENRTFYIFKSALIQEIAYESLLKSHRQRLHTQVAKVMEAEFEDYVTTEILAHHYTEAAIVEKAIYYWEKASEKAVRISAYKEACSHISKALAIYSTLPADEEDAATELRLQVQYSSSLRILKGWAHVEVQRAYEICLKLAKNVGDSLKLFQTLFGIWITYLIDANLDKALEVAQDLMAMGKRMKSEEMMHYGSLAISNVCFYRGEPKKADKHLWMYTQYYDAKKRDFYLQNFGLEPMVFHSCIATWFPPLLADTEETKKRFETLQAVDKEFDNVFSSTVLRTSEAICHLIRDDHAQGLPKAEDVLRITKDMGYTFYPAWCTNIRGWAMAKSGNLEEGLKEAIKGRDMLSADGCNNLTLPSAAVASIYLLKKEYKKALEEVEVGLHYVKRNAERLTEAELLRLKAIALLHTTNDQELADKTFQRSIDIADELTMPLWKYRTLNSWYEFSGTEQKKRLATEIKNHMELWPKALGSIEYEKAREILAAV